ncbi:NAD(P)-dependent oxidoreductase [Subtercola sp. YIM 133946]|uniref:NAD(P)-dependent oxidoreductase n=1 Tax=Subtercola sp. YIM 133946 TaxID=3118909 RepID=UPI002F95AE9A
MTNAPADQRVGVQRVGVRRVGVLGVGRMGRPIAERLSAAGFDVTAFDSDPARLEGLDAHGIGSAASAARLAESSNLLVTILPGPPEIADALGGADALLGRMHPGACWLDLSSGDPELMARLAGEAEGRGVLTAEAPMGGGVEAARDGSLTFYVAGRPRAVDRALPVLHALGQPSDIHLLGETPGAGLTAKLLANLLWFGQSIAVTEALLLGSRLGVDLPALRSALASSAGGSAFIDRHLDALLTGDYLESFGLDRVVEELDTMNRLAAGAATPFELSKLVTSIHHRALDRFGPVAGELLAARLLEEQAGTTLAAELADDTRGTDPA